jgi:hypothetical protein
VNPEYRAYLLTALTKRDQPTTDADELLAAAGGVEIYAWVEADR